MKEATILIDHHNAHQAIGRFYPEKRAQIFDPRVCAWVFERLSRDLARVMKVSFPDLTHLRLEYYSGWFEDEVDSEYHELVRSTIPKGSQRAGEGSWRAVVRHGIATNLKCLPSTTLYYTLRRRTFGDSLKWKLPASGCASPSDCPILQTAELLEKQRCVDARCGVRLSSVLSNREQKLVDTHITCDLLDLARQGGVVAVVSNDTDFVPGLLQAAQMNPDNVAWVLLGADGTRGAASDPCKLLAESFGVNCSVIPLTR
jgi:hypothetical protein